MSFKIKKLEVENFVVFVNRTTIDFSTASINNIEASYKNDSSQSNGAGKSLIIDAISLALFGKGIRAGYMSEYISSKKPKNGIYIGLELEDDKNNILKIERWRRSNSEVNKAKLWHKGKSISDDCTIPKIDEMIQEFIGITHSNFISCIFSVMVPGFLKLKPAQRFETLENALAVKRMENILKKVNTSLRYSEEKLNGINDLLIDKQNLLGREVAKKEIYSLNIESLRKNIIVQNKELDTFIEQEIILSNNRQEALNILNKILLKLDSNNSKQLELKSEITALKNSKSKLDIKNKTIESIIRPNSSGKLECLICKSPVNSRSKEHIKEHYVSEIEIIDKETEKLNSNLVKLISSFKTQEESKIKLKEYISNIENELKILQASMIACEKTIVSSKKSIEIAESNFNDSFLEDLKKECLLLANQKEHLKKDIKMTIAWKQALSKNGLRLAYIKEEVSTLSAIASKYASATYNSPMNISFFINEEKENPTLDFTVNGKNSSVFSTGESRLLEIAMTLSLMTLLKTAGLTLNFLILDEALDGLSVTNKNNVIRVIDELAESQQILVISHDQMIKNRSGHVISICKDSISKESTVTILTR